MMLLSFLESIDTDILLAVNGSNSPAFDSLMWWMSDRWIWIPLYLLVAASLVRRLGWAKGIAVIAAAATVIALTDQTCSTIIRPAVARLRPSNPDNPINIGLHIVNGYRGGSYGFPSCHAANTFAFALFISLILRNRYIAMSLIAWTMLVSYSRIYLGVHYPGDVIGGFLIGGFYASTCYMALKLLSLPGNRISGQDRSRKARGKRLPKTARW